MPDLNIDELKEIVTKLEELPEALRSASRAMTASARDWSLNTRDAWLYGLIVRWPQPCIAELSSQHQWEPEDARRLTRLQDAVFAGHNALPILLAAVKELLEDRERLDWFDIHGTYVEKKGYGADDAWVTIRFNDACGSGEGVNIREAINDARKAKP